MPNNASQSNETPNQPTNPPAKPADTPAPAPSGQEQSPAVAPTDAAKTYTQADIDKAVAKAQKDLQKQISDAEAKAKLSEEERAKAEIGELRLQLRERDARDAVTAEATKLGIKSANMLYKLVQDQLEFDEKGKVKNLADVFDSAKSEYPELFSAKTQPQTSIDAGAGTGGNQPTITKEALAKMSPGEINALDWNVVQKVLTEK